MSIHYLDWITSYGGPLVLIPESDISLWYGNETPSHAKEHSIIGNDKTDYDIACAVVEYIENIHIRGVSILVLGDEPLRTAWWPTSDTSGIIVRWMYALSEFDVLKYIQHIPSEYEWTADRDFTCEYEALVLFDSVLPGAQLTVDEKKIVKLMPGTYIIRTMIYNPDDQTSLLVHQLTMR